ncbi:histidine kinase [Rhodanobacter sp. 7MK24]|uniref:sensor histidine kinase n=1 Tax=Rhodanobacter sp. 7MK24 TaxID=2775922 RepID=UPI00177BE980|nr:histidine kinase [Rhodanobacter sp. 7MK24]MBD8880080.1 histidine kinase [Rhodanobacter sp. 7MK24]
MHLPDFGTVDEPSPLPDFCSLPVLFTLLVTGALAATVVWLAAGDHRDFSGYSVGILFVSWLALAIVVVLCLLRPWLRCLPGHLPYLAAWLLVMPIVGVASWVAHGLDGALHMNLVSGGTVAFVRDNVLIAALLGAAILRYFYVAAQWRLRLAAVTRAQVEALQARIRPHFLFNSMNTVAALIPLDPVAAERTVEDLAELFRAALGQHEQGDGTLDEELALLDRYLAIEQLRLGERLRVERLLDDLPRDFPLPRLLLQPLVENAVRHGIQPLREGGVVSLRGTRESDAIVIEIANPLPASPARGGNGHGLDSVRRRVAFRYGPRAIVQAGPRNERYVVSLRLPLLDKGDRDARTDRR